MLLCNYSTAISKHKKRPSRPQNRNTAKQPVYCGALLWYYWLTAIAKPKFTKPKKYVELLRCCGLIATPQDSDTAKQKTKKSYRFALRKKLETAKHRNLKPQIELWGMLSTPSTSYTRCVAIRVVLAGPPPSPVRPYWLLVIVAA